jgi:AcrR family transcriptional regulator
MPKIETESVAQHRNWRRSQLIDAASAIALESGGGSVTVAAVAERAGLSRTSVYEYFASSADMAADLVIEELETFTKELAAITESESLPLRSIEMWIVASLRYIADGRHMLAKAFNAIDMPQNRIATIRAAHGALLAPLRQNLQAMGIEDLNLALTLIQGATDAATKKIESGSDAENVIRCTRDFCIAGLQALAS